MLAASLSFSVAPFVAAVAPLLLVPFFARLAGVALGSLGLLGPRLRLGVAFLGDSALGVTSVSASPPSASVGSALMALPRFLGAALVGVASSSSSASPLVAALALVFLAGVAAAALLTLAPPRSFFLTVRKQALADAAVL